MIANGINTLRGWLGSHVVLDREKARAIFVSDRPARELARENGVTVGQIHAVWNGRRWGEATRDLEAPPRKRGRKNTGLTLDLRSLPSPPAKDLDESAAAPAEIVQATQPPRDSLTLRRSPSGRIVIAEIRRAGESTRIIPLLTAAAVEAQIALAHRLDQSVIDERTRTGEEEACQAMTD